MKTKALVSNAMAGGLIAVINITVAISVAALMFSKTKPEYFAAGVTVLLIGTVVTGLGGTLASGFSGIVVAPRSGLAPIFAGQVAAVIFSMKAAPQDAVLPTVIMTIMVTTFFTGLFLLILGQLKLGSLVRYIPYPVMGGFFAGIGLIFVEGGIAVATGVSVGLDTFSRFTSPNVYLLALPALVFAFLLYSLQRRIGHWSVFPSMLIVSIAAFYAVFSLNGETNAGASAAGWLPTIANTSATIPAFDFTSLGLVDWSVIVHQAGSVVVVAIMCSIILLLDVSGIEIITGRDLVPDRELKVAGATNILNSVAGGYPGVHVASDTGFTYKLGGEKRLMGFIYAGAVILAIVAGTGFIGTIPTFVLGGLLIYVGIDFLVDWVWKTRFSLPPTDYLVVLIILAVVAAVGILQGIAFGFALSIVLFVINYSRLSTVKSELSGGERASNVDRDLTVREVLNREGGKILILRLQGFIFFGTADKLLSTIKHRLASQSSQQKIEYLVLDFQFVDQLDTSAVQAFAKLAQISVNEAFHIVVTGADDQMLEQLARASLLTGLDDPLKRLSFDHLDDGIAWCEEKILEALDLTESEEETALEDRLAQNLGDRGAAHDIVPYWTRETRQAGHDVFRKGDRGDALYLVHAGEAAVALPLANGQERIVRVFRSGSVVGEMAVYTGAPRTATVHIAKDAVLYKLTAASLERMQREHPDAAGAFHAFIVRLLAERLERADRELQKN